MRESDQDKIQGEILEKYPGTNPDIDIDWDIVEIAFKAGQMSVVEKVIRDINLILKHSPIKTVSVRREVGNYLQQLKDWVES